MWREIFEPVIVGRTLHKDGRRPGQRGHESELNIRIISIEFNSNFFMM